MARPKANAAAPKMTRNTTDAATTSLTKIDELIGVVSKHYADAKASVQEAGIAIIRHAMDYGDCSRAKVLARAVPARERNSLIGWFRMFSPIGINIGKTANDDKCRFIDRESKQYNEFDIEKAKVHKWYDDPAMVNPEPKPLNTLGYFYDRLDSFLKQAIADADKDADKAKYAPEVREDLKRQAGEIMTLVQKYKVKHLAAVAASGGEESAGDRTPSIPVGQAA